MSPVDIAIDSEGRVYIAGNGRVRRVEADGIIHTIAGTGLSNGPLGDGGPATAASMEPSGIDVAPDGTLYITDLSHGNRLRKVTPDGTISTIAGGGDCAFTCDYRFLPCAENVPAAAACFTQPMRVRVSPWGSIYVHDDAYTRRIREITTDGRIRTVAGTGILGISGSDGPPTSAEIAVKEMTFGLDGSLYVSECTGYYCNNSVDTRIHCEGSKRCGAEHCGDGKTDEFEECDEGNTNDGDACSNDCRMKAVKKPWKAYAPIVQLHSEEEFNPADPASFLRCSSLRWAGGEVCGNEPVAGHVSAAGFRHHPYFHGASDYDGSGGVCPMADPQLSSHCRTRPWDAKECADMSVDDFPEAQGFYLDPPDDDPRCPRAGLETPTAPVFYDYKERDYLVYWFFYAYDQADIGQLHDQYHEGDWENVTIKLDPDRNVPVAMAFFAHGHPTVVPWDKVQRAGTHPVVYSAKGTHGSYTHVGSHDTAGPDFVFEDQTDADGMTWKTERKLKEVRKQGWWWFGGGWGEVSYMSPNTFVPPSDYSGPLGPSRYKTGVLDDAQWNLGPTCGE
jgi:cysteine-rich repeat protein